MKDDKKSAPGSVKGMPSNSYAKRYASGKALRTACPRESHADWRLSGRRRDPVEMVLASEKGRLPAPEGAVVSRWFVVRH